MYGHDLAAVHDAGYAAHARHASARVIELLGPPTSSGGLVVELGCGGGVSSARLAEAGYSVLGADISAPMIELARARVPGGRFVCASYADLEFPPCVAVTAIGEVLNYLPEGDPPALPPLFARIAEALAPDGLFVLDFATPGRCPGGERTSHAEGEDWSVSARSVEQGRTLTRTITTFRRVGELYRRGREVHRLRLITPEEMTAMLAEAGLTAQPIDRYGDDAFPPGIAALAARRG